MTGSDTTPQAQMEAQMAKFDSYATRDGEVVQLEKKETKDAGKVEKVVEKAAKPAAVAKADSAAGSDGLRKLEDSDDESDEVDDAGDSDGTSDGAEGEEAAPEKKAEAAKRKNIPADKRIRHYTWKASEAERRAEAAEARAAALEEQLRGGVTQKEGLTPQKETAKEDARPSPDKYTYGELDAKYISDLARYEARQEFAAQTAAQEKTRQQEAAAAEQRELKTAYDAQIAKGVDKYEDFQEVVLEGNWPLSDTLGKLLLKSDVGADIAYHLASDPKEAARIYGLSPLAQAAHFGRLEAKFSSPPSTGANPDDDESDEVDDEVDEPAPKPKAKTSKAPPPPKTRVRGANGKQSSPETDSFEEFERRWARENGA